MNQCATPKPVVVMLLTRQPFAEHSGRAMMLRRRVLQMRASYEVHVIVVGRPGGLASDAEMEFVPMASLASLVLNGIRLFGEPLQSWLYYSSGAANRVAAVIAERGASAVYVDMLRLSPLVSKTPTCTAHVQDFDDVLSERYRLAAEGEGSYSLLGLLARDRPRLAWLAGVCARQILKLESRLCAKAERKLLARCDLALLTSPNEVETLRASASGPDDAQEHAIMAAPPVMRVHSASGKVPGRRLIFLGNMRYAENVVMIRALDEAASSLQSDGLWPVDAVIEVVGDHDPALADEVDSKVFRFLGRVPDLSVMIGAGIFLAPVTSGTGVKLKVLEGMSLGCPVISTPKGCEGIAARQNRDLLVAGDARGVLAAALALRNHEGLKKRLARRGRAYVERHHGLSIDGKVSAAVHEAIVRASQRDPVPGKQSAPPLRTRRRADRAVR